jgi:hypothetical protein
VIARANRFLAGVSGLHAADCLRDFLLLETVEVLGWWAVLDLLEGAYETRVWRLPRPRGQESELRFRASVARYWPRWAGNLSPRQYPSPELVARQAASIPLAHLPAQPVKAPLEVAPVATAAPACQCRELEQRIAAVEDQLAELRRWRWPDSSWQGSSSWQGWSWRSS